MHHRARRRLRVPHHVVVEALDPGDLDVHEDEPHPLGVVELAVRRGSSNARCDDNARARVTPQPHARGSASVRHRPPHGDVRPDLGVLPPDAMRDEARPLVEAARGHAGVAPYERPTRPVTWATTAASTADPTPVDRHASSVAMPRNRHAPARSGSHGHGSGVDDGGAHDVAVAVGGGERGGAGQVVRGPADPVGRGTGPSTRPRSPWVTDGGTRVTGTAWSEESTAPTVPSGP